MKEENYYEGWCSLEIVEKHLIYLSEHFNIYEKGDPFSLNFIKSQTYKFQSIYPYRVFHSSSYIIKKTRCSVCGKINSIRNSCGHRLREIYDGIRCVRYIIDFEPKHIALVKNPLWKYRVLFDVDENTGDLLDNYDYSFISYLMDILPSPFVKWNYHFTQKLIPHTEFKGFKESDNCPCRSSKPYKECCINKKGILMPFIEFGGFKPLKNPSEIRRFPVKPKKPRKIKKTNKMHTYKTIIIKQECFFID